MTIKPRRIRPDSIAFNLLHKLATPATLLAFVIALISPDFPLFGAKSNEHPNFIIIFADDQGYQDLGINGAPKIKTPNIDRMAKEGMHFTDFYSAASVCTPSRAALLTGCYPERVGNLPVLFPRSNRGLNPKETTIAKMLKQKGYATACVGKWHLGHQKQFLPTNHGFDQYFGIPYSNDMGIDASMDLAKDILWRNGKTEQDFRKGNVGGPPLMRGTEVIEAPVDQSTLTRRYTQEAIKFIKANKDGPFFLYLPHTMPHIPLYATPEFEGKSDAGLYGDTIEEIDWSTGQILQTLRDLKIDKNTFVVYTSDNGPWRLDQNSWVKGNKNRRVGGSALPLRGYKFSRFEGGMREPTVMWWPGRIPAGKVCREVASTIDLLPTFAALSGAKLPELKIDGKSIVPLIEGRPDAKTPHPAYFYRTEAVRFGHWKLKKKELYDLSKDIGESKNVAKDNPDVAARLAKLLEDHKKELSENKRPPGQGEVIAKKFKGLPGWTLLGGNFRLQKGVLKQNSTKGEAAIFGPATKYGDYTLEVMAKATGGKEGFRIMFRAKDSKNYYRWSTGAFNNTLHSVMVVTDGKVVKRGKDTPGKIEHGKWIALKVTVQGKNIKCYIDDKLVNEAEFAAYPQGGIGLGSNNAKVEFKNLKVTDADGKVLLEAMK